MRASSTRNRRPLTRRLFTGKRAVLILALTLLAFTTSACDDPAESAPTDEQTSETSGDETEAPAPAAEIDPQAEVVSGEDISVTLAEVEEAVDRLRIFAPRGEDGSFIEPDERWFRTAQAQSSLVNNLLHFKVMRLAAERWELTVTPEDELAALQEEEQMRPFLPLFQEGEESEKLRAQLESAGLSVDDVRHLLHDIVLGKKVHAELVERFDDEALWAIYEAANDTAELVVVRGTNTPTSREIDEAVETMSAEIEAFHRDNPRIYMRPDTAKILVLRPQSGDKPEAVREAATRLKAGEDAQAIAAGLGLELRPEAYVIEPENPAIFEEDAEDIGFMMDGPRGQYAYKVLERMPPEPMELNRPLRREIASQLLRTRGVVDSAARRLEPAIGILEKAPTGDALTESEIESLMTELENAGFEAVHSEPFSLRGQGLVPGIGLAEEVVAATSSLTLGSPTFEEPVKSRDDVYVFRMVDRARPDRAAFDAEREEFREQFMARNARRLTMEFVNKTRDEHNITVDLKPVQARFPLMSKEDYAAFMAEHNAGQQAAPAPAEPEASKTQSPSER